MPSDDSKDAAPQGDTGRNQSVSIVKGIVGAIPVVGSIVAEMVGQLIPIQRMERLEDYVRRLGERLSDFKESDLRRRFQNPENLDLFEEGAIQSTRGLSAERRAYIADVVAKGISGGEKESIEAKRILSLLREVDDDQIIILASHLHRNSDDDGFRERHKRVLEPVGAHLQSDQDEMDAATMHEAAREPLLRLGLLRQRFRRTKKGEIPRVRRRDRDAKGDISRADASWSTFASVRRSCGCR